MEVIRHAGFLAVPSTITSGKWWVFSEDRAGIYCEGYLHHLAVGEFIAYNTVKVNGRVRAYKLGETDTLPDAIKLYRELH